MMMNKIEYDTDMLPEDYTMQEVIDIFEKYDTLIYDSRGGHPGLPESLFGIRLIDISSPTRDDINFLDDIDIYAV